ncbi:hypothetical protein Scep_030176 [Stephania cephalantha]|uniref:Uncharacterized protein n=1 Tax=Stephania cephalantha TaxID=152367 RepID=A0AAP0E1Z3_9MAGN
MAESAGAEGRRRRLPVRPGRISSGRRRRAGGVAARWNAARQQLADQQRDERRRLAARTARWRQLADGGAQGERRRTANGGEQGERRRTDRRSEEARTAAARWRRSAVSRAAGDSGGGQQRGRRRGSAGSYAGNQVKGSEGFHLKGSGGMETRSLLIILKLRTKYKVSIEYLSVTSITVSYLHWLFNLQLSAPLQHYLSLFAKSVTYLTTEINDRSIMSLIAINQQHTSTDYQFVVDLSLISKWYLQPRALLLVLANPFHPKREDPRAPS